MDIAYELATLLQNSGFGTVAEDIFVGEIEPDKQGIYLVRNGGGSDFYTVLERPLIDIYAVKTKSIEAVDLLENIKRHLHRLHSTETENAYIYSILEVGGLIDVVRDGQFNKIYKIGVSLLVRDKNLIS